jgi:hypothetical protein
MCVLCDIAIEDYRSYFLLHTLKLLPILLLFTFIDRVSLSCSSSIDSRALVAEPRRNTPESYGDVVDFKERAPGD